MPSVPKNHVEFSVSAINHRGERVPEISLCPATLVETHSSPAALSSVAGGKGVFVGHPSWRLDGAWSGLLHEPSLPTIFEHELKQPGWPAIAAKVDAALRMASVAPNETSITGIQQAADELLRSDDPDLPSKTAFARANLVAGFALGIMDFHGLGPAGPTINDRRRRYLVAHPTEMTRASNLPEDYRSVVMPDPFRRGAHVTPRPIDTDAIRGLDSNLLWWIPCNATGKPLHQETSRTLTGWYRHQRVDGLDSVPLRPTLNEVRPETSPCTPDVANGADFINTFTPCYSPAVFGQVSDCLTVHNLALSGALCEAAHIANSEALFDSAEMVGSPQHLVSAARRYVDQGLLSPPRLDGGDSRGNHPQASLDPLSRLLVDMARRHLVSIMLRHPVVLHPSLLYRAGATEPRTAHAHGSEFSHDGRALSAGGPLIYLIARSEGMALPCSHNTKDEAALNDFARSPWVAACLAGNFYPTAAPLKLPNTLCAGVTLPEKFTGRSVTLSKVIRMAMRDQHLATALIASIVELDRRLPLPATPIARLAASIYKRCESPRSRSQPADTPPAFLDLSSRVLSNPFLVEALEDLRSDRTKKSGSAFLSYLSTSRGSHSTIEADMPSVALLSAYCRSGARFTVAAPQGPREPIPDVGVIFNPTYAQDCSYFDRVLSGSELIPVALNARHCPPFIAGVSQARRANLVFCPSGVHSATEDLLSDTARRLGALHKMLQVHSRERTPRAIARALLKIAFPNALTYDPDVDPPRGVVDCGTRRDGDSLPHIAEPDDPEEWGRLGLRADAVIETFYRALQAHLDQAFGEGAPIAIDEVNPATLSAAPMLGDYQTFYSAGATVFPSTDDIPAASTTWAETTKSIIKRTRMVESLTPAPGAPQSVPRGRATARRI